MIITYTDAGKGKEVPSVPLYPCTPRPARPVTQLPSCHEFTSKPQHTHHGGHNLAY